jgi:hypothetical protein
MAVGEPTEDLSAHAWAGRGSIDQRVGSSTANRLRPGAESPQGAVSKRPRSMFYRWSPVLRRFVTITVLQGCPRRAPLNPAVEMGR